MYFSKTYFSGDQKINKAQKNAETLCSFFNFALLWKFVLWYHLNFGYIWYKDYRIGIFIEAN